MQQDTKAAVVSSTFHRDFLPSHCKEGPKAISEHPEVGSVHLLHKLDRLVIEPRPGSTKQEPKEGNRLLSSHWIVWRWTGQPSCNP